MVLGLRALRCQIGFDAGGRRRRLWGPALGAWLAVWAGLGCGASGDPVGSSGAGLAGSAGAASSALAAGPPGGSGARGLDVDGGSQPPGGDAGAAAPGGPQAGLGREVAGRRSRPDAGLLWERACSFEEAVCVHGAPGVSPGALGATLRHAEGALRAQRVLDVPAPLPDGLLGGSPALDVYVVPGSEAPFAAADLEMLSGRFDRSSAFVVLPPPDLWDFCEARFRTARVVAEASLMRLDAGVEGGVLGMTGSYLASLNGACSSIEIPAVDVFQRSPERALTETPAGSAVDGAFVFPWYLDEAYGTGRPGSVITGLVAIAAQRTPPGAWVFHNEPDIFDALRFVARERGVTLEDLLLDFTVARGFLGSRSDEGHLIDVARFGEAGRARFEWAVPYSSLPRRLAPLRPIEPTGATYIWLDLEGAPAGAGLTFVADWELDVLFRWALVKVDKSGREVSRVNVAGIYGSTHAEKTVVGIDNLAGLLVVGVNTGSMDRSRPFDPDEGPFMPRSYTVTLYP